MIQEVIIGLVFVASLVYLGRLIIRQFMVKTGCGAGCQKCNAIDFAELERKINAASNNLR